MERMKSSTIRRSNLSKEKMAVLEALTKFKNSTTNSNDDISINSEPIEDGSPEVYVRPNKEKELDLLWKDFKMPKGERSPIVYLGIGFVAGIIATLLVSAFIGMSSGNFHPNFKLNFKLPAATAPSAKTQTNQDDKLNFLPSSESDTNATATETSASVAANEEYTVQSGDTMESIARRFYGSYSPDKINMIMKANNMTDPNKLAIGQKLIIPMSENNSSTEQTTEATE